MHVCQCDLSLDISHQFVLLLWSKIFQCIFVHFTDFLRFFPKWIKNWRSVWITNSWVKLASLSFLYLQTLPNETEVFQHFSSNLSYIMIRINLHFLRHSFCILFLINFHRTLVRNFTPWVPLSIFYVLSQKLNKKNPIIYPNLLLSKDMSQIYAYFCEILHMYLSQNSKSGRENF